MVSVSCLFEHYSTEDGLSHRSISDIIKDSKGFMWFALLTASINLMAILSLLIKPDRETVLPFHPPG